MLFKVFRKKLIDAINILNTVASTTDRNVAAAAARGAVEIGEKRSKGLRNVEKASSAVETSAQAPQPTPF